MISKVMKTAVIIFLILGFLGAAVFGVFIMNDMSGHGHGGCIAATVNGGLCPEKYDAFQFVIFHLDFFKSFSAAIVNSGLASASLALLVLVLVAGMGVFANLRRMAPAFTANYFPGRFTASYSSPLQRKFVRWLSFHENSPAF